VRQLIRVRRSSDRGTIAGLAGKPATAECTLLI
jgi:hypothetical protein